MSLAQILHVLGYKKPGRKKAGPKKLTPKKLMTSLKRIGPRAATVFLRPLEKHDFENWRQAYSMVGAPRNQWDEGPWKQTELTPAKFRELLKKQKQLRAEDRFYTYGIFRADDGVFVGFVTFMDVSRGIFQNAYLGYRIFNPYWGLGYATEAVRQSLVIAFKELKLHRVEAGISPENEGSIRVAQAVGLRCEGLSRKRLLVDGKWVDLAIFAATREDFGRRYQK